MADSEGASAEKKPKSKKLLVIILAVVVLLVAGGGGAFFMLKKKGGGEDEEGGHADAPAVDPKAVPTYLPLDNMIVNLADPGGEKFAQIGITLEIDDPKTAERIKSFMPSIRSGILVLISQRTSQELLGREGKELLAADVQAEVGKPLGIVADKAGAKPKKNDKAAEEGEDDEAEAKPKKKVKAGPASPVRKVLFSSFIVQ